MHWNIFNFVSFERWSFRLVRDDSILVVKKRRKKLSNREGIEKDQTERGREKTKKDSAMKQVSLPKDALKRSLKNNCIRQRDR